MKRDDSLWKAILEDIFDDMLLFFYPNAKEIFDFSKGFEFLDKELNDLFPRHDDTSIKYVDKLVKVFLLNGTEEWILVHIEVQGQLDKSFSERMFTYYYRIKDHYKKDVTAWAILTDDQKNFKPNQYHTTYLGTELTYKYNVYKIMEQDEQALRASNNIFATIVLTTLINLKQKTFDETNRINLNIEIIKNLLIKGFDKKKVGAVMNFLRFFVRFNDEDNITFKKEIEKISGKNTTMGIEEFLLERATKEGIDIGVEKGREEGIDIGVEKGIDIGVEKGREESLLKGFENGLDVPMLSNIFDFSQAKVISILKKHGKMME